MPLTPSSSADPSRPDKGETKKAALYDVDGDEIWAQSKLKAEVTGEQIAVSLLVPTSVLPHGHYLMRVSGLTGSGEPESLATYTFRVLPQ